MRYLLSLIIVIIVIGFGATHSRLSAKHVSTLGALADARVTFTQVPPSESKITWVHDNGKSEAHHLPETCGGGGVFFDYDNDGWMDIYLVNSGPSDFFSPSKPLKSALYHNNHDGTFTDVTDKAGVPANIFGMGAAAGDY